jgi:hypothetical protein
MTKAQTTWDTMTPRQRLAAVNIDIMDHIDFSILSGLVTMGEIHVVPDLPTAGTNGVDVFYGEAFVLSLNRKQFALRAVARDDAQIVTPLFGVHRHL